MLNVDKDLKNADWPKRTDDVAISARLVMTKKAGSTSSTTRNASASLGRLPSTTNTAEQSTNQQR